MENERRGFKSRKWEYEPQDGEKMKRRDGLGINVIRSKRDLPKSERHCKVCGREFGSRDGLGINVIRRSEGDRTICINCEEEPRIFVTWYDSARKIIIHAPKTTGDEWTELTNEIEEKVKKLNEELKSDEK